MKFLSALVLSVVLSQLAHADFSSIRMDGKPLQEKYAIYYLTPTSLSKGKTVCYMSGEKANAEQELTDYFQTIDKAETRRTYQVVSAEVSSILFQETVYECLRDAGHIDYSVCLEFGRVLSTTDFLLSPCTHQAQLR